MRYLTYHQQPHYWLGVNYWPRHAGPLMWRKWRPKLVRAELEQMRQMGMNVCRSFLYTPDFLPRPDYIDPLMLERLDQFIALCAETRIGTILTLLVGHMSGENWDLPWRAGRDLYHDPFMLRQQVQYVQAIVSRYEGEEAIWGWLLTNEMPLYGGETNWESGLLWARTLLSAVKAVDPLRPVSLGDGAWQSLGRDNGLPVDEIAQLADFLGPHVYRTETDPLRHAYLPALAVRAADRGKPVLFEEFGGSSSAMSNEHGADYYREVLHTTLLAGACGALGWCYSDFDLPNQRPYSHHAFELFFGITRSDGSPKPAAQEIQRFSSIMAQVDLAVYKLPAFQAALVVPSYFFHSYPFSADDRGVMAQNLLEAYTLAQQAGVASDLVQEPLLPPEIELGGEWTIPAQLRLLLAPVTQKLTAPYWLAIERWVRAGGTFYASYFHGVQDFHNGLWIPNFPSLFGARHCLRYGLVETPPEGITLKFIQAALGFASGEELVVGRAGNFFGVGYLPLEVDSAQVLAIGPDGQPALIRHRLGRGQAIFCAYPLEYYLAETPNVHQRDSTYRLYNGLADLAHLDRPYRSNNPWVQVGYLRGQRQDLVWVMNHAWEPQAVEITAGPATDLETGERLRDKSIHLELPKKGVRVLRVARR
ncbi:MAG: cellulase family glycosylhydrolase [Deinococcus sp.]|nr:cellulase family glycosylhydrolase [Deinococcus sp.]